MFSDASIVGVIVTAVLLPAAGQLLAVGVAKFMGWSVGKLRKPAARPPD